MRRSAPDAFALLLAILLFAGNAVAQGINYSGNGGRHTIQGRIYDTSGMRTVDTSLKVILESSGTGDLTVLVGTNGTFAFKNLLPGGYTVSIEASDSHEGFRESIFIDDPGATSVTGGIRLNSPPRVFNVQVYLQPKRVVYSGPKPGVVDARLGGISTVALEHYRKAQALNAEGRVSAAITELERAVALDRNFTLAYTDLGLLYSRLPNLDKALAAFASAVASAPDDFEANLNFGVANYHKRYGTEAEKALKIAAAINASAVMPHYYLGLLYIQQKQIDAARSELETASSLLGEKPFAMLHRYLGGIYMAKKMNKEAVSELEKYLSLAPDAQDAPRIRQTITDLKKAND